MIKHVIFIIITLLFLFSCSKGLDDSTIEAIEENIQFIEDSSSSTSISSILNENEIVIFGETHYVQEHQELIVSLLPELSDKGYNIIYQELFHCFTWLVSDYINGEINEIPEFLLYFDGTLIEGIKSFNETVAVDSRIELRYMDVNHWKPNFLRSIEEMEKIIGSITLFRNLKNTIPDEADYLTNLVSINNLLNGESGKYRNELGIKWYSRILEMVEMEIKSYNYRTSRNDTDREVIMAEIIRLESNNLPSGKLIINTGMFHAQKQVFMGKKIDRLRQLLDRAFDKVYSLAFIGIRGRYKNTFDATSKIPFDLAEVASSNNMIRLIDEIAGNKMSFLPLQNEAFNDDIEISYTPETKVKAPLGQQFDAILTYPEIKVLKSMDTYDYRK